MSSEMVTWWIESEHAHAFTPKNVAWVRALTFEMLLSLRGAL